MLMNHVARGHLSLTLDSELLKTYCMIKTYGQRRPIPCCQFAAQKKNREINGFLSVWHGTLLNASSPLNAVLNHLVSNRSHA